MSSSIITPRTLRGFADVLPANARHQRRMTHSIEQTFASFGYDPISTPAVEYAEILRGKGGEESDKQMIEFDDQGGRRVALRFDLTVPLARFVAQHESTIKRPFRSYHIGTVWRGERPQRGRYREFTQCDADIIGESGPAAEAEILAMFQAALTSMEIGPFAMRVSDRRILNGLLSGLELVDHTLPVLRALDKIEKVGADGVRAELLAAGASEAQCQTLVRFAQCQGDTNEATLAAMEELVGEHDEGRAGIAAVARLVDLVEAAGGDPSALKIDPSIVRGLDYYTGMVFETVLTEALHVGSVCSGGRYDDLAGLYTKTNLPGVGGSIGISRILAAIEGSERLSEVPTGQPLVIVTNSGDEQLHDAVSLARRVRAHTELAVETYPVSVKHAAQMKYADAVGARFVLTVDTDSQLSVKDMRTGDRHSVSEVDVPELLTKLVQSD